MALHLVVAELDAKGVGVEGDELVHRVDSVVEAGLFDEDGDVLVGREGNSEIN